MSAIKIFAKNSAALFISQLLVSLLSMLMAIAIARTLGDSIFGEYSFAIAFTAIFVLIADLGYLTLTVREVSKDHETAEMYLSNVTGIRLILTVVVFFIIVAFINLMGYSSEIKMIVYVFGAVSLISTLSGIYFVTFRAFQRMQYEAIINLLEGASRLGLGLVVLLLGYGLLELGLVFLFSAFISLAATLIICYKKFFRPRVRLNMKFFRETIGIAVPLCTLPLLAILYIRADTILLSLMKDSAVVGWYNAAYNIVLTLKLIPSLLVAALFPAAMSISTQSITSYNYYFQKLTMYLLLLAIPITIGIFILSKPIILLAFGQDFINSVDSLKILAFDCLLFFIYLPLANSLIGMGKERIVAFCSGICLIVNIILNLFLIPTWSLLGAAIATILSETCLLGLFMYYRREAFQPILVLKYSAKPLIASLPMIVILIIFGNSILISVPLASAAYFITIFLIGGIDENEQLVLRSFLGSVKNRILGQ